MKIESPCFGIHQVSGKVFNEIMDEGKTVDTECLRCKKEIKVWIKKEFKLYVEEIKK